MLFVVPTPIGNLGDITLRSLEIFKTADIVLTEDGRVTSKLFQLLNIDHKPKYINLIKNHSFNFVPVRNSLEALKNDNHLVIALVTDAGTPGLSDPGFEVIEMAKSMDLAYTVLPGANALVPAIVASNLVSKDFRFYGFLPIKKGRETAWKEIGEAKIPVVLYESVHRIEKCIQEMQKYLEPNRKVSILKDLSKLYENIWTATVADLSRYELKQKGEFVVVIDKM